MSMELNHFLKYCPFLLHILHNALLLVSLSLFLCKGNFTLIVLLIYWVELSDMWICGCCDSKFMQFPREEIRARKSICFVGDTYFLFHRDDLAEGAVEVSGMSGSAYGKVCSDDEYSHSMPSHA